jgi:hypothetical protein
MPIPVTDLLTTLAAENKSPSERLPVLTSMSSAISAIMDVAMILAVMVKLKATAELANKKGTSRPEPLIGNTPNNRSKNGKGKIRALSV